MINMKTMQWNKYENNAKKQWKKHWKLESIGKNYITPKKYLITKCNKVNICYTI